jgi:hypothetical protein
MDSLIDAICGKRIGHVIGSINECGYDEDEDDFIF